MRIGLLCPYDLSQPGGVQEQVKGLRAALRGYDDEVVILAPGAGDDDDTVDLGGTVSVPGNLSKVPISLDPTVGRRIKAATAGLDLVHVHEPLMPMASLMALRCDRPVVATFHAATSPLGTRLYRLLGPRIRSLLGPNLRRVTAVSPTAAAPVSDSLPVSIVPNGLDVAAFTRDGQPSALRVCFLGRDEPRKGLDVLLAAWADVAAEIPDAELIAMGANRGSEGVQWLGRVGERTKVDTLSSSAIYVAPHLGRESFGIVLVEAMAAGAAVVASDLEAFRYVAGDAALYFPPGDSKALAERLTSLLRGEDERRRLRAAGRERAQRFDWERVAGHYRSVYQQALS
ncbi:MAG TPA: glycosyltransferase family 4 protein [Acidimicrobiia bacterium]|nr:glycosyltransferase family 4 protein [Acidimicrobiia bacterium]